MYLTISLASKKKPFDTKWPVYENPPFPGGKANFFSSKPYLFETDGTGKLIPTEKNTSIFLFKNRNIPCKHILRKLDWTVKRMFLPT
jgi:hypothetical protein